MKTLQNVQLGLHFHIGNATLAGENTAENAVFSIAYALIGKNVSSVPGWLQYIDEHGNLSAARLPEQAFAPVSLCEQDYDADPINGRPTFSFWFHSHNPITIELAKALKEFCCAQLRIAALEMATEYAKASLHHEWLVSETVEYPL